LSLFSDSKKKDSFSVGIGIFLVCLFAFILVYIGTWKKAYSESFYNLSFKVNFIQNIRPGLKIRYQGGVIVGEVVGIESNLSEHFLHAIIKRDFKISHQSYISLVKQGAMGMYYLNVDMYNHEFHKSFYKEGDVIEIPDVTPFDVTLEKLSVMLAIEKGTSPLSARIGDLRDMIRTVSRQPMLQPSVLTTFIKNKVINVNHGIRNMLVFNQAIYDAVYSMDKTLSVTAADMSKSIPSYRLKTSEYRKYLIYDTKKENMQFFHDEILYYSLLFDIIALKRIVIKYNQFPYRIIFN